MGTLDVLLAVDAATTGSARPRTTVRHRHLSPAPLVVVAYRMSGESAAPLAVALGTSEGAPRFLVAAEPRSRTIRFRDVLNPLAEAVGRWLVGYEETEPLEEGVEEGTVEPLCVDAPQILVPNRATADLVGAVLGRSLRYLRSTDEYPVPDATVLLGTHLTWFERQAQVPGSCVLVAATDLVRRHWATGQSALEDEDLHVLLGWVDPPAGLSGSEAADDVERQRIEGSLTAAGPTPDPIWDRAELQPLLDAFNHARAGDDSEAAVAAHGGEVIELATSALRPGWTATWAAHRLLARMPAGYTVGDRWRADRRAWTRHLQRVRDDVAHFGTRDSARQAAFTLANFEDAQAALDRGEMVDDPLVAAGLVAGGEALLGMVTDLDLDRTVPARRQTWRPLIHLRLSDPCSIPVGRKLAWLDHERPTPKERVRLKVTIIELDGMDLTVEVFGGHGRGRPKANLFPWIGQEILLAPVAGSTIPKPTAPTEVPWTHLGPQPRFRSELAE